MPNPYVDNSSIAYDSTRDRLLMINTPGYRKPFSGKVCALDFKTIEVELLTPAGHDHAHHFANVDKWCYDAANDLLLLGTVLKDSGDHTATPAYDCGNNRWVTLDIKYAVEKRGQHTRRKFPHQRSDGLMFDARRKLIWGTDTNSQVYVLRLDPKRAGVKPLNRGD